MNAFYAYENIFYNDGSLPNTIRGVIDSALWFFNYFCVLWIVVSSQEDLTNKVPMRMTMILSRVDIYSV